MEAKNKLRFRVPASSQKIYAGYLRGEPGISQFVPKGLGTPALRDRADDVRNAYLPANARANETALISLVHYL